MDMVTHISNVIKHQFPDFYREQGDNFVAFVEAYYEWMEQSGNVIFQSRKLPEFDDVDQTLTEFLTHFREKYMRGLPPEIVGNQRLLQKHILELYRAKGSIAGLKLLFRLMYNEDVEVYVPSYDIFTTSDGVWTQPQYLEVSHTVDFNNFQNQTITGDLSGAEAIVVSAEVRYIEDTFQYLLFVTDVTGTFQPGETISYPNQNIYTHPRILGSPRNTTVVNSVNGFEVGDVLQVVDTSEKKKIKGVVSDTYTAPGRIDFVLVEGGVDYSADTIVSITTGSNTTGSGATFIIGNIGNQRPFNYSSDKLAPYIS